MKSRTNRFAALLLCILLAALLTGCADGKAKLTGRIAHIYGGTILIAGEDGELYFAAIGDADTGGEKLAPGQYAELEYRDGLKETYPAELGKLEKIALTGEESNIISLYTDITREVIGKQQPKAIAYDFSETKHLTDAEQEAVGYICWTELDAEPYYGTQEELLEEEILIKKADTVYLRGGCILRYRQNAEDPYLLTVTVRRNVQEEAVYVYQLAESGGEWTKTLLESPDQQTEE